MSFDPGLMAALRESRSRRCRAAWSAMRRDAGAPIRRANVARCATSGRRSRARPQFLAYRVQDLTSAPPLLARHVLRWPLLTWTVRTPRTAARAARYADQMIFEGFRP